MKRIAIAGALLALAVPASASAQDAPSPRQNAAKACKELRSSLGAETFKTTYARKKGKSSFGKCVSTWKRTASEAHRNAAQACKAERDDENFAAAHDGQTFEQHYGTNKNGKNAYGKCVSSKSRDEIEEEVDATENAAKACKRERSEDADKFAADYGTRRNAFGKCVSAKAKAQQDAESETQES